MKKLILALFIVLGVLSFSSSRISCVFGFRDDNYEQHPVVEVVETTGAIKNFLFGFKQHSDAAKRMYKKIENSRKVEFAIAKYSERLLLEILKKLDKKKYKGKVEIIEIGDENKDIREIVSRNGWIYNTYSSTEEIPGTVKLSGYEVNKGEVIQKFLRNYINGWKHDQ
ncbi:hypothetical protein [Leptotrichia alba]|uniref:Lipoprotein n=1 Tax=Leptotrichia alba TaxID=3239304 RepID=A0AB39V496_9FUSO